MLDISPECVHNRFTVSTVLSNTCLYMYRSDRALIPIGDEKRIQEVVSDFCSYVACVCDFNWWSLL